MLAHQFGFPLPISVTSGIWNWEKPWRESGARAAGRKTACLGSGFVLEFANGD